MEALPLWHCMCVEVVRVEACLRDDSTQIGQEAPSSEGTAHAQ